MPFEEEIISRSIISKSLSYSFSWLGDCFENWLSRETFLRKKLALLKSRKWSILTAVGLGGLVYYAYCRKLQTAKKPPTQTTDLKRKPQNYSEDAENTYQTANASNYPHPNANPSSSYPPPINYNQNSQHYQQNSRPTSRSHQTSTSSYRPRPPSSNLQSITMNPKSIRTTPRTNIRPSYDFSGDETHSVLSSQTAGSNRFYNAASELVRFQVPGSTTGSIGNQTVCTELETMTKSGREDLRGCLTGIEKLLDHAQAALESDSCQNSQAGNLSYTRDPYRRDSPTLNRMSVSYASSCHQAPTITLLEQMRGQIEQVKHELQTVEQDEQISISRNLGRSLEYTANPTNSKLPESYISDLSESTQNTLQNTPQYTPQNTPQNTPQRVSNQFEFKNQTSIPENTSYPSNLGMNRKRTQPSMSAMSVLSDATDGWFSCDSGDENSQNTINELTDDLTPKNSRNLTPNNSFADFITVSALDVLQTEINGNTSNNNNTTIINTPLKSSRSKNASFIKIPLNSSFNNSNRATLSNSSSSISSRIHNPDKTLYEQVQNSKINVPYRKDRHQICGCKDLPDFLTKVHILRISWDNLLRKLGPELAEFLESSGKFILTGTMRVADKLPEPMITAYNNFINYSSTTDPIEQLSEVKHRKVQMYNFFDIVLDYIILDAFSDLSDPPQSIKTVMNNRWLGERFKETSLTTCVWSIIKAKKGRVAVKNGFLYHYYSLWENVSPILCWGFMGPKSNKLSILCENLHKNLLGMIQDMFSFYSMDFSSQAKFDYKLCDMVLSNFVKTCEAVSASSKLEATNVNQGTNLHVPTDIYELSKKIRGNMDKLLE